MLRQEPCPENALGKVKLMMANNFSVYLHDAPAHGRYSRAGRARSSGCVRIAEPMWLAEHLLAGSSRWRRDGVRDRVLSGWETTRVYLPRPMPLELTYTTVVVEENGRLGFREGL